MNKLVADAEQTKKDIVTLRRVANSPYSYGYGVLEAILKDIAYEHGRRCFKPRCHTCDSIVRALSMCDAIDEVTRTGR